MPPLYPEPRFQAANWKTLAKGHSDVLSKWHKFCLLQSVTQHLEFFVFVFKMNNYKVTVTVDKVSGLSVSYKWSQSISDHKLQFLTNKSLGRGNEDTSGFNSFCWTDKIILQTAHWVV